MLCNLSQARYGALQSTTAACLGKLVKAFQICNGMLLFAWGYYCMCLSSLGSCALVDSHLRV